MVKTILRLCSLIVLLLSAGLGGGHAIAQTYAPYRQLCYGATTANDVQHWMTPGRQIVYAGFYNAGCDYVYMNYCDGIWNGSSIDHYIGYAIFDCQISDWDYSYGCPAPALPDPAVGPNIDVIAGSSVWVMSHYDEPDSLAANFSEITYSSGCPAGAAVFMNLAGPPNLDAVNSGYCGDINAVSTPYIYPKIDTDTMYDGRAVIHVAAVEDPRCSYPEEGIETRSLVYYRKEADNLIDPSSGTWDGPFFMDSTYAMSAIVRADRNSGHVYYAYLKPILYYDYMATNPCDVSKYYCTNDVVYRESWDDGATWSSQIQVTDFIAAYGEDIVDPAAYDLSGLVDPTGVFHLVWTSIDRNPEWSEAEFNTAKLWHWDNASNCISLVYDASHPSVFNSSECFGKFTTAVSKPNISWCDDKLYVSFVRFGAHVSTIYADSAIDYSANGYLNGDIMVAVSDATGSNGRVWSEAINLTQTMSDDCIAGDCYSENWATMAMYSTDSLMIEYIEDKDPGVYGFDSLSEMTDNPVMFMTWPCFSMADMGEKVSYITIPALDSNNHVPIYASVCPFGDETDCVNERYDYGKITIMNTGNVPLTYTAYSDQPWLTISNGSSGTIYPGNGPGGADSPYWTGASACSMPGVIEWEVDGATLPEGDTAVNIVVDFVNPEAQNFAVPGKPLVKKKAKARWTIMLFMNADNNLEYNAFKDMDELERYGSNKHINILALLDRSDKYIDFDGDWDGTRTYLIMKGTKYFRIDSKNLTGARAADPEENMGDPAVLSGFVEWCIDNYPAEKYALILWGHGDGWKKDQSDLNVFNKAIGPDESSDDDDLGVANDEFVTALNSIHTKLGIDHKLDLLGFNACLMQMWEVMFEAEDHVKYQVGSEEAIPAYGWNYDRILERLMKNKNMTPKELGDVICDVNVNDENDNEKQPNFSCVDLSKINNLTEKFKIFSEKMRLAAGTGNSEAINNIRRSIADDGYEYGKPDIHYVDMYYLTDLIMSNKGLPDYLTTAAKDVQDLVGPAVTALENDDNHKDWSHGVSLYYNHPDSGYDDSYDLVMTSDSTTWNEFLKGDYLTANCQGKCGDPNFDTRVNVSDAVYLINFVFSGGNPPLPVRACGDANSDTKVNVSDAVRLINYVFSAGNPPTDCTAGDPAWGGEDCCEFVSP